MSNRVEFNDLLKEIISKELKSRFVEIKDNINRNGAKLPRELEDVRTFSDRDPWMINEEEQYDFHGEIVGIKDVSSRIRKEFIFMTPYDLEHSLGSEFKDLIQAGWDISAYVDSFSDGRDQHGNPDITKGEEERLKEDLRKIECITHEIKKANKAIYRQWVKLSEEAETSYSDLDENMVEGHSKGSASNQKSSHVGFEQADGKKHELREKMIEEYQKLVNEQIKPTYRTLLYKVVENEDFSIQKNNKGEERIHWASANGTSRDVSIKRFQELLRIIKKSPHSKG